MNLKLLESIRNLPASSGVYQYFDDKGALLYIGKAKSLKNRVKSYFRFTPTLSAAPNLSPRIYKMVSEIVHLKYIVVNSEQDSLILENSLIKQLKPKYNILLRDDKTYPYIYLNYAEDFPRPEITRKILKGRDIVYYGPFSTGARDILNSLYETFPLVQKSACVKGGRICLFYQIKRCLGPCEGKVSKERYREILDRAVSLINDKRGLLAILEEEMLRLAEDMRFEEAALLRDRIVKIKSIDTFSQIDLAKLENIDIFAIKHTTKRAALVKMFMRDGKIVSSSHATFRIDEKFAIEEAYKRVLLNYYKEEIPLKPNSIIIGDEIEDFELVQAFIHEKLAKKVDIYTPQRGEKKHLLELAFKNCDEVLSHEDQKRVQEERTKEEIQELFDLKNFPQRIEIFDTSHMSSEWSVGSMVIYEEQFLKDEYRHYNLESRDEYAQMRELLFRRVESFEKNPPPDLWVIDGGKGQLNLAHDIIQSSGANVDVIAIAKEKIDSKAHRAKGGAKDKIITLHKELTLSQNDRRLMFIQKLRDEAHRFAIGFHREQKAKIKSKISTLKVKGIGEAKTKRLLDYFGSFESIKRASLAELQKVVGREDAQKLYDTLQNQ